MFKQITIIGVGLIGGSIGLAARRKKLAQEVVGVCRQAKSLKAAKAKGAIDRGSLHCQTAVSDADLVILATPVSQIVRIVRLIIPCLKAGAIISDAGSTKLEIVRKIEKFLPKNLHFIGAHPLAGSEKRSAKFAQGDLFKGSICILTKSARTSPAAYKRVRRFWQKIGSRVIELTPDAHDKIVAVISHLPHLAATQLIKVAEDDLAFAAGGFLDTTRIAASDAEIWSDICLSNKRFIVRAVNRYISRLRLVRDLINKNDRRRLSGEFKAAKILRDGLQKTD